MKIKYTVLATAALVLASSMASAAINVTATPDLLLVAFDPVTSSTYVRDLGVSLSALNTSQTFNAPASSIFATQFAGVAPSAIQWDVVALNNTSAPVTYSTGTLAEFAGLVAQNVVDVASIQTNSNGGFTQLDTAANGFAKANGEYTGVKNGADQTNGQVIANNFGYAFPVSGNGVGSSLNFMKVATDGTASQLFVNSTLASFDPSNAKGGYFTLTDAAGDLSWTNAATVAPVPLPGAALLFMPGLLAMFGLGRRRQNKAA